MLKVVSVVVFVVSRIHHCISGPYNISSACQNTLIRKERQWGVNVLSFLSFHSFLFSLQGLYSQTFQGLISIYIVF